MLFMHTKENCSIEESFESKKILNQQFKIYTSLSQTRSDVNMVQSLVPIWEELRKRSGVHEATVPSDPGKPLPEDVVRLLSAGLDSEKKLNELCSEAETTLFCTPYEKEFRETDIIGSASPPASLCKNAKLLEEGTDISLKSLNIDEAQSVEKCGMLDIKDADIEAQNLLKWLATSQAAEDINSDDELACETILSPLLPSATIDKVLEKANMVYESESQKECQDILDSVDVFELELLKENPSRSLDHNCPVEGSSNSMIPQVDGSNEDEFSSRCASLDGTSSAVEIKSERNSASEPHVLDNTDTTTVSTVKKYKQWGSLPFSRTGKVNNDGEHATSEATRLFKKGTRDSTHSDYLSRNEIRNNTHIVRNDGTGASDSKEVHGLVNCSLRDLMRRKRSYRVEHAERESGPTKKLHSNRHEEPNLWQKQLDLKTLRNGKEETELQKNCDHKVGNIHDKLLLSSGSDSFLQASMPKDECFGQHDMECLDASKVLRNSANECSSLMHEEHGLHKLETLRIIDSMDKSVADRDKSAKDGIVYAKTVASDAYTPHSSLGVQLKTDANHNFKASEGFHQIDSAASSSGQSSSVNDRLSGKSTYVGKNSFGSIGFVQHDQIKSCEHAVGKSASSDRRVLLSEKVDNQRLGKNVLCETVRSEPIINDPKVNHMKLTEVSTGKKSLACENLEGNFSLPTFSDNQLHLDEDDEMPGNALDVFLPVSARNSEKQMKSWNRCDTIKTHRSNGTKGVATYYQNDGSHLYLLKPNILPPSVSSVRRWLFCDEREPEAENKDVPKCTSGPLLTHTPDQLHQKPVASGLPCRPELHQDTGTGKKLPRSSEGQTERIKACIDGSQDISQISAPDQKSNLTPLSQIGFQDPASVGRGQQLTLLSIEVLADSRADLLPDPQFDGINIVALGFQNDCDAAIEVLVLMHSKLEPCQRNIDGLSDCKVLVFTNEKQLFKEFIKIVSSSDPDMLIGWDIQGGSLGFLAERASHLGLGLLNGLSRTPSDSWIASKDTNTFEKGILELDIPDTPSLDCCVQESSIIADEWGRTHASGVHVGGRIVLNVWRLIRGEVKLNLYSTEAVAEAVLRRKVPLIPHKVLTRWFSSGPGRARYQCIKYYTERAKLNLEILNQLDMVNRTSELARVFGIDFFSVLSRGSQYRVESMFLRLAHTQNYIAISPGNQQVRRGVLPRLLEEILSTRIMVKQAMKKLAPSEAVLQRIFNARQLALKLISNVTYGYTAAGFSGRMPCAELADSIVQCGRSTLEKAISFVNLHEKWNAQVIYGDTDSMFVLLKGRTVKESFQIGSEIASAITAMNPSPVTLKMEKVYHPCFLITKKRYVGYSYENPDQVEPVFDAKGIETVRRDTCGAVAKMMEQSLRLFFEHQDLSEVKTYLQRQWKRILSSRVSLKDFIFAKEVRLGTYSARISSLPPAAIVATKAMRVDRRAEPRYAERIPYVVIHGEPGARLVDMVVDPLEVLAIDSPFRINDLYYINKQIIPALQRVFGLVGADLNQWFGEMPRPIREASAKHTFTANTHRTRIDYYYLSKHCALCGGLVQASARLCNQCSEDGVAAATAVISKTSKLEQEMQHLVAICHHCGGGDRLLESGVKCTSISCLVFFERRKVQKELQAATHVAADKGLYPRCTVEWF